jgi:hypothetical protein
LPESRKILLLPGTVYRVGYFLIASFKKEQLKLNKIYNEDFRKLLHIVRIWKNFDLFLPRTVDGVGYPVHAEVKHVAHLGVGVGEVPILPKIQIK